MNRSLVLFFQLSWSETPTFRINLVIICHEHLQPLWIVTPNIPKHNSHCFSDVEVRSQIVPHQCFPTSRLSRLDPPVFQHGLLGKPPIYKAGWWLTYPSEKYDFVSWGYEIPNIWKVIIHSMVPKHQPEMAVCQNLVPLVNIKIAGKWMFIPLKMYL